MSEKQDIKPLFKEFPPVSTEAWREKLKVDLKTDDIDKKLNWHTIDGMDINAIYRDEDLDNLNFLESIPSLKSTKNNDWQINRIIETGELYKANAIAKQAIDRGAKSIEFNCSQVRKYDSLAILLDGIDMEEVALGFDKPMSYKIILNHLISYVEEKGFDKSKIVLFFNWDAMAYRLISGKYYKTFDDNIKELKALVEGAKKHFPNSKIISINGQHFHNAGATSVQELAMSLSAAVEYIHRLLDKGLLLEDVLEKLYFRMAIGSAYFVEIAKIRAMRYLWAKICTAFGAKKENHKVAFIHSISSSWNKTIYDPYVNMLRTTTETMSVALGGADMISVLPFDKSYKNENEFSSRIAQNQQILIKEEAHFDKVVDPAAGSYYIENLTNALIDNAWNLFLQIEDMGGYAEALENGFIKKEIVKSSEKQFKEAAIRKINILGTNQFPNQQENMLGEIEKELWGKKSEVELKRVSQAFEQLRLRTEKYALTHDKPKLLLISFGDVVMRKARASFMSNFFAAAAYDILEMEDEISIEEILKVTKEKKVQIIGLCSSDKEYLDFAMPLISEMKQQNSKPIIVVAAKPIGIADELSALGVDDFIYAGMDMLEILNKYSNLLMPL